MKKLTVDTAMEALAPHMRQIMLCEVLADEGRLKPKLEKLCAAWNVEPVILSSGIMHQAKTLKRLAQYAQESIDD